MAQRELQINQGRLAGAEASEALASHDYRPTIQPTRYVQAQADAR